MTSTTFVDRSDPPIAASWLNDVNNLVYNGVLGTGLVTAAGILAPTVFVSDARLDVQINRTTGEWIGFNTQDAFLSNGVTKAHYGLTLGLDSTLDPLNQSVHLSGYGGLGFYTTGVLRGLFASNGDFQLPGRFFVSASGVATTVPFFPCDPATSINSTAAIYGGTGAPNNATGGNGSYYFRSDTPGSANQRIYVKSGGSWVGIV